MAPTRRSRNKSDAADVAPSSDPVEATSPSKQKLKFNKPISWPVGRPIAEGELLKRLEALYHELEQTEDAGDTESTDENFLKTEASNLCAERLLKHRNKGVQAYTAACLVEILRIKAPHAPLTGKEITDFFAMVIEHIIPNITDVSSPYHTQHRHTLMSLDEMESICLILDTKSETQLLRALFTVSFDVLSGPAKSSGKEVTRIIASTLTSLLTTLVREVATVPDDVVDIVLAQFLRADPRATGSSSSKQKKGAAPVDEKQATLLHDAPAAYTMAQEICSANDVRMARHVLRYFSSVLLDTTMMAESTTKKPHRRKHDDADDDELLKGPSEEDLKETQKAHRLLRELWRAAPSVLQEIVPQLETELSTDNTPIRMIAVETVGDMIAGIGASGPPSFPVLDPAAYPSQSLSSSTSTKSYDFLKTPSAAVPFIARFQSTYQAFLGRRNDKSPSIRSAWTTAVGRIISTFAGGVGLDPEEEDTLLKYFAESLVDVDEKVRHAAIEAIKNCSFTTIVDRLGKLGGVNEEGSILSHLADRAKDKKLSIRTDAIRLLADIWGVATGALLKGDESVADVLGGIPSKLINAYYVNDPDIHKAVDRALFDSMIPLTFPPSKASVTDAVTKNGTDDKSSHDQLRVERILLFVKSLDQKAKAAFFSKQKQQPQLGKIMLAFLQQCEFYNGGIIEPPQGKTEEEVQGMLSRLIATSVQLLPDKQRATEDLKKFAKQHDRRNYNLIRNCCNIESDWSKIRKSIREMSKRIEDTTPSSSLSSILNTILTLLYRCSLLIFNKSNIPAIIHFSKTDDKGLGATAHEMLKECSKTQGEVFSTHVQDLCKTLTNDAPTSSKPHRLSAVDDLKACADFARQFPEKIPQDKKLSAGLMAYVKHGQPLAAKYAARILLTTTAKEKRSGCATEIYNACAKGFKYGKEGFLSRLAALSQVVLYGALALEVSQTDYMHKLAINDVLLNSEASPPVNAKDEDPDWTDEPDKHIQAKLWAMKILINILRAIPDGEDVTEAAAPVFILLTSISNKMGQVSAKSPMSKAHASRLRLFAVHSLLKLAREKRFNELITATIFNRIAFMAQDPCYEIRASFVKKTTKYLGQRRLPNRFYTPLFLLAFEPDVQLKNSTETWLRSRIRAFARDKDMVIELVIARLISVLTQYPDYEENVESLAELAPFFTFYLRAVATEENISPINYVTQRVKNVSDGISPGSTRIYVLSDLVHEIIRKWTDRNGWNLPAWSARFNLPTGIFAALGSHEESVAIAQKNYLPEGMSDALDKVVDDALRKSKRSKRVRTENGASRVKKRPRNSEETKGTTPIKKKKVAKTPKRKKISDDIPSSERRRSGRARSSRNYRENSGDDDADEDEDMDDADSEVNGSARKRSGKEADVQSISSGDSSDMEED